MTTAIVSAPMVRFDLEGGPLSEALMRSVTAVTVVQRLGRPAQLRLELRNPRADDVEQLAHDGAVIVARVDGHDIDLFNGRVVGVRRSWTIDGVEEVTVRAHDRLDEMRRERRSVAFTDSTPIDVARSIIEGYGLLCQTDRAAPTVAAIHQVAESDLRFIRRVLAPLGLAPTLRGDTVHLVPVGGIGHPMQLRPGVELHELSIDQRLTQPVDGGVAGWNSATAEPITAGDADLRAGWSLDAVLAGQLAEAATAHRRSEQVVATGTTGGDTALRPGTPVELRRASTGSSPALTTPSRLTATTCTHRIDAEHGYITEFSTEATDPVSEPSSLDLTLGLVVDVDDPQQQARVKVELVALGGVVTEWVPVVCAGAGDGVGIVALPDVGASVVVLGPADAPGNGVVLGGLFGRHVAPGPPIAGGRSRTFVARLPGGGQIIIADDEQRVLVDNGAGSRFEMSPEIVTIHAAADLEIAAPGRHLLIRADTIDFERG